MRDISLLTRVARGLPLVLAAAVLVGSLLAGSDTYAQGVKFKQGTTRSITAGTSDSATAQDYYGFIAWKSAVASAKTETLPACVLSNNGVTITVVDEQGTAGTNNITVSASAGTVGGAANTPILTNNGGLILNCDGAHTNWMVVAATSSGVVSSCATLNAIGYFPVTGTTISCLGSAGTATTVLHGGAGAPVFGPVNLGADVSSNLPVTNLDGGTNADVNHVWTGDGHWHTPTGSQTLFSAVIGGTGTAYTATISGFALNVGWGVCGTITTTSGANPTLAVNAFAAKSIVFNAGSGTPVAVGPGGIVNPTTQCYVYDGTNFVIVSPPVTSPAITSLPHTVSPGEFGVCQTFVFKASGTLTMPAVATLAGGGCVQIQTIGFPVTLTPNGSDAINGGATGASVTIPADTEGTYVTTPAANSISVPLGTVQSCPFTIGPGQNASTVPIPFCRFPVGRTIYNIKCMVAAVAGGAATFDIWAAATSVTAANVTTSGTKLNTTACNANTLTGSPGSEQDMGVASSQVAASSELWLVSSSWPSGTTSTAVVTPQVDFR